MKENRKRVNDYLKMSTQRLATDKNSPQAYNVLRQKAKRARYQVSNKT